MLLYDIILLILLQFHFRFHDLTLHITTTINDPYDVNSAGIILR